MFLKHHVTPHITTFEVEAGFNAHIAEQKPQALLREFGYTASTPSLNTPLPSIATNLACTSIDIPPVATATLTVDHILFFANSPIAGRPRAPASPLAYNRSSSLDTAVPTHVAPDNHSSNTIHRPVPTCALPCASSRNGSVKTRGNHRKGRRMLDVFVAVPIDLPRLNNTAEIVTNATAGGFLNTAAGFDINTTTTVVINPSVVELLQAPTTGDQDIEGPLSPPSLSSSVGNDTTPKPGRSE